MEPESDPEPKENEEDDSVVCKFRYCEVIVQEMS